MSVQPLQSIAASAAFLVNVNGEHELSVANQWNRCKAGALLMKNELLEQIRHELQTQFERLSKAALEAHAAATDPGSKAEGKYDTRSLEASYLAAGQARQVDEIAEALRIFKSWVLPDFDDFTPIDAGALVEVEIGGTTDFFLLAPASGGLVIAHAGQEVTLLTPASVLYRRLLGMRSGDALDSPSLQVRRVL